MEKISETFIRKEKVRKLKIKILNEIEKELKKIKKELKSCGTRFDVLVKDSFALLNLKEYISDEYAFMDYTAQYTDIDVVFYQIKDEYLNIWLQDDYHFVYNFLWQAKECEYNIFNMLHDYYFGYNFTSIYDCLAYEKKMNG